MVVEIKISDAYNKNYHVPRLKVTFREKNIVDQQTTFARKKHMKKFKLSLVTRISYFPRNLDQLRQSSICLL